MKRLLLFNPETEYALASGASFYTPPARVEKLRREQQLLPEAWAECGDMILVDDDSELASDFRLVEWKMLGQVFQENPDLIVEPWGWNHALIRKLKDHGVPESELPDAKTMDRIRELAHRRTTVTLNMLWNEMAPSCKRTEVPKELSTIEDCMEFYRSNPGCWMKAPWSSSGRGVINTAADMTDVLVEQWCRGILRRQGSVMGEKGADRISDFATEWRMIDGKAEYLGLSAFFTSNRGKYISNEHMGQSKLKEKFEFECNMGIDDVTALQKKILEQVLTEYEGLLGVDMIVERKGNLRPFVEVNLRRTMGMLHIIS
ncbi:MAG: hypothetical protein K2N35_10615 [Muribaculaceae bacterium]|nr:hypothetical protein [Muribaculaceae bacterium]